MGVVTTIFNRRKTCRLLTESRGNYLKKTKMDYIFIIISVFGFALQFVLMQIYEKQIKQNLITGIFLTIITNVVGAVFFFAINLCKINISERAIFLAGLLAVDMVAYNLLSLRALSLGNLAVYSMFMMLGGMALPVLYGVIFLKEDLSVCKIIGLISLTVFMVLQALSSRNKSGEKQQANSQDQTAKEKQKNRIYFLYCMTVFIVNGLTGVISKAHQVGENAVDEKSFLVLSCAFTVILGLLIFVIERLATRKKTLQKELMAMLKAKPLGISAALGIVMYGANYFLLLAARTVPASAQFPIVSGGVIALSALASVLIFKDKLSKTETVAVVGSFVSTVLFAF